MTLPEMRVFRWRLYEIERYAKSFRHVLERFPASGIYGDDYGLRSLWDEFCFEAQEGPVSELEYAWDHTLDGFVQAIVERIPAHHQELLSWSIAQEQEHVPRQHQWHRFDVVK
ncbi:MAG: hypothetical protein HC843_01410 [Sphingomonadales bacterium]|nr:hypothetical protein [Sphingomonadales bacterium]